MTDSGRERKRDEDAVEKREEALDEALEESFPASDPPAQTIPKQHPDEDDPPSER